MNQHPVFAQVRQRAPKVHCLTNPVTMQDVANVLLAAGGSAVMAQDAAEVEEITTLCDATLLNTGVPSAEKFHACALAGVRANELGHPVVLDPVGAGASAFRRSQLDALLEQVRPTVIRCNQEEAAALLGVRQKRDLRLGIHGPYAQESIPHYLRLFKQMHPEANLTLKDGSRDAMLQGLADEELDVVIVPDFGLHLDEGYEELELSSEQVRFMTGPHSALAGRQFVSSEELTGQTIFRVEDQSDDAKSQPLPEYYTRLGLANNPVQRVNTLLEATILVQAGLGIAPLPGGMEQKLARDVSVFSIEGDSFRIRTLALRKMPPVSVAADHFFQVIREDLEARENEA